MTVTITIQTDNAAFEDNGIGAEVARILKEIAVEIHDDTNVDNWDRNLRDENGNTVGKLEVTD